MYTENEKLLPTPITQIMESAYIDYSMSVIISRALPDARDGLKPVQRRILYAMNRLGLLHNRSFDKCAGVVGEVLKDFHPHGDMSVYDALVRMAQRWVMRYPLIDPQGNFGSIDNDPPAAYRYTECRLSSLAEELLRDIDKNTVDFVPNYKESTTEPSVLPAGLPNLLMNGSTGIAVGMTTNIPPHNLSELIDAIFLIIDTPTCTVDEIMQILPGPDFPTGGTIAGTKGIEQYMRTGRGIVRVRGTAHVEELKGGKEQVVITEIPYALNRATLVTKLAELINTKQIPEVSDLRDESDENTRIVIELKRDESTRVVINKIAKMTPFESSFGVILLALDDRRPKQMNIKEMLECYIEHRRKVVTRRTEFLLGKARDRAHTLEGFIVALANLDDFVEIIRDSKDREEAKQRLMTKYSYEEFPSFIVEMIRRAADQEGITDDISLFLPKEKMLTDKQTTLILELRLYQLTGLEQEKIHEEYGQILKQILYYESILANEDKLLSVIKEELSALKEKYESPRRTKLVPAEGEFRMEDVIANEGTIITISHKGFIKRTAVSSYRSQKRGGKGVIGTGQYDDDFVERLFTASTHDYILFFMSNGRVYVEKVYEIPEGTRTSKGRSIVNVLQMQKEEAISAMICIKEFDTEQNIVLCTKKGIVKKTSLSEYKNFRKGGIIGINIDDDDRLVAARLTDSNNELVIVTHSGMSIRFHEDDLRGQGRATRGVKGITLKRDDDFVKAMAIVDSNAALLIACENGVGKRTEFDEYRLQSRGGSGIIAIKTASNVAGALAVTESDEVMMLTAGGQAVRSPVKDIRVIGRTTQGVRLINLADNDKLIGISRVINTEDDGIDEIEEQLEGDEGNQEPF